jgi:predicted RNA binding protein YcfA (HicA-like mRNA interferase family)
MCSIDIVKVLEADGWVLRAVRGSRHVFHHPSRPGHITAPHPKKDLGAGLVHKLFKQAGIRARR